MSDTAALVRYRAEHIASFERRQTQLRTTTTTEAQINASSAVFLVAGSGNATAVTRGSNGLIPARASDLNQYTATLTEWHDLTRRTKFNIYTSQGDGRRIMQEDAVAVINRTIDDNIITELANATQDAGSAVPMTVRKMLHSKVILGNNNVQVDGNVTVLLTPAAHAYLMEAKEFSSAEYVKHQAFESSLPEFMWMGIRFIEHSGLPGAGTSSEKCFMYHKNAIGHACDMGAADVQIGYNGEQDFSWARSSGFMGSKILQNSGIVVIPHDGSGFAAS